MKERGEDCNLCGLALTLPFLSFFVPFAKEERVLGEDIGTVIGSW